MKAAYECTWHTVAVKKRSCFVYVERRYGSSTHEARTGKVRYLPGL